MLFMQQYFDIFCYIFKYHFSRIHSLSNILCCISVINLPGFQKYNIPDIFTSSDICHISDFFFFTQQITIYLKFSTESNLTIFPSLKTILLKLVRYRNISRPTFQIYLYFWISSYPSAINR